MLPRLVLLTTPVLLRFEGVELFRRLLLPEWVGLVERFAASAGIALGGKSRLGLPASGAVAFSMRAQVR